MYPTLAFCAAYQKSEMPARICRVALITDLFLGSGVLLLGIILRSQLSGLCVGGGVMLAGASIILHLPRQQPVTVAESDVEKPFIIRRTEAQTPRRIRADGKRRAEINGGDTSPYSSPPGSPQPQVKRATSHAAEA